jgi:iron complex outermembrane receptor protein
MMTKGKILLWALASTAFTAPASAQDGDAGRAADEIVVTARQRAEVLQDVPVAVSAISGVALEKAGVTQTRELFASTPGLYFSQTGQRQNDEQFYLTIRGVGSSPVVEPSVGVFVDGVYMPSLGWTADFLDLERVEILRGPQGALFGRNTEGGAVSIVTRKPSAELRGRVSAEVAEFGSWRGSASVSGPLAENLYAGISGFASTTNGYMRNVTRNEHQDNRDRHGGRLMLRAVDVGGFEVLLSGDYMKSKGRFDAFGDAVAGQAITVVDPQAPAAARGTTLVSNPLAGRRYTTYGNDENRVSSENYGAALQIMRDIGPAVLTSITGYRRVRSRDIYDNDAIATASSVNGALTKQRILSQELRLVSDTQGPLSWIAGAYGFKERLDQDRLSQFFSGTTAGPIAGSGNSFGYVSDEATIRRDGLAIFGEVNYDVTEQLELSLGARYSYEKVRQDPNLNVAVQIGAVVVNVANATPRRKAFDGFSPSASLSYKLQPGILVYASAATGFKGGGFTKEVPNTPLQNAALDNETSLNYELGLKADLLDRAVRLNMALFYTKLKDQQLATRIELSPGTGVYIPSTLNVGRGHSQGVEVETVIRPVRPLRITGNLSYTDTRFDDYVASPATATAPAYDRAGQAFPEVPKWLASASVEYAFELGNDLTLVPNVSWRHVGSKYVGQGNASIPFITIDSYDLFDAQLSLSKGPWSVVAFVKNIGDKYYLANRFQNQPATSAPGFLSWGKPGAPRQFGARFSYDF